MSNDLGDVFSDYLQGFLGVPRSSWGHGNYTRALELWDCCSLFSEEVETVMAKKKTREEGIWLFNQW